MYELVSTSVPNGLIAGTHGFATVAMTKGMPDAIRGRVEGFCAYPHRVSAHDESYFAENPTNWFHLQHSNGEHIIGRTVPAEFDYTGRTNRVSHTLVFAAQEMPIHGGAFVLMSEAMRFVSKWTDEPKYLPVDKVTAGRLGLADLPKQVTPSNWISSFGQDGASFARRFAALLMQNVTTGVKSIYFKTSTSVDLDGTKLLALFSDLIDLIPEDVRPRVMFSTFAACVPGAVTCHLRGVYDKDRAFEAASAMHPWVDLEHGRIVNAELLPAEISAMKSPIMATANVPDSDADRDRRNDKLRLSVLKNDERTNRPTQRMVWRPQSNENGNDHSMLWIVLIVVLVAFAGIGAAFAYWLYVDRQRRQRGDEVLQQANEAEKRQVEAHEQRVRASQLAVEEKARQEDENRRLKENEEKKRQADGHKDEKRENEAIQRDNEERVKAAQKKQQAEAAKKDAEKLSYEAELNKFPSQIKAVMKIGERLDDKLKDSEKEKLTNENSIVVWWWNGTVLTHDFCRYERVERRAIGNQKKSKVEYKFAKVDVGESPWVIYRLLGRWDSDKKKFENESVYWQWCEALQKPRKLFENGQEADLVLPCFGEKGEAWNLWQKSYPKMFWCVTWSEKGKCLFCDQLKLGRSVFLKGKQKSFEEKISMLKTRVNDEIVAAKECTNNLSTLSKDCDNVKNLRADISKIEDQLKPKLGGAKDDANEEQNNRNRKKMNELWDKIKTVLLGHELCWKTTNNHKDLEKAIKKLEGMTKCTHNHQMKIDQFKQEIDLLETQKNSISTGVDNQKFVIEEVLDKLPDGKKLGFNDMHQKETE